MFERCAGQVSVVEMSRPCDRGPAMGEGEKRKRKRKRCLDDHGMVGFQGLSGRLQRRDRKCSGDLASRGISESPENAP